MAALGRLKKTFPSFRGKSSQCSRKTIGTVSSGNGGNEVIMTFFKTANEHTNIFSAVQYELEKTHGNYKVKSPLNDMRTNYIF